MVQWRMFKQKAIELLGGSIATAAEAIGVSYQAVNQWPDVLPPRIADRVYAAIARKQFPELEDSVQSAPAVQAEAGAVNV